MLVMVYSESGLLHKPESDYDFWPTFGESRSTILFGSFQARATYLDEVSKYSSNFVKLMLTLYGCHERRPHPFRL